MDIAFNSSDGCSLGVEVEMQLVDAETRELASAGTEILSSLGESHPAGDHPKAKHELFECTVEAITGICSTVDEARRDLEVTIGEVAGQARARGLRLACAGTHPFSRYQDQTISPSPRYERLVNEMRWMAERLQIFGVHFHVGVRSPEKVIAIANALSGYIGHFLALSASSPFWMGRDTGLASARSKVFEGLPTAGLPEPLEDWSDFEAFMETLVCAGAIQSVREVWWDIRPHPDFGTVEIRACDGLPTLDEVASMAALAQSLVEWLDTLDDRGYTLPAPATWVVRQNKWQAARHGLDAELIVDEKGARRPARDLVRELVEELLPVARRIGCADELASVEHVLTHGASHERQRAIVTEGGSLKDVVDHLAGELDASLPSR